jgi:ribonuclease J
MRANKMMDSLESGLGDKAGEAGVIWSMWEGYWEHDRHVRPFCERHGIEPVHIHTSGHAPWPDLANLIRGLKPDLIVPVHTERAQVFAEHFKNVFLPVDGDPFQA